VIARIGGDEFVILLSKTDSDEANTIIERINANISGHHIKEVTSSVAFGVSTKNQKSENIMNIFIKAENQMYKNKPCTPCNNPVSMDE
jgi:diguanylate cyclase (GGDEF)-like protein